MAYQTQEARGVTVNLGSGDAVSVKEVADMISPIQVHVPERPNDLVGTLANTCVAKSLLGFEAKKDFRVQMKSDVDAILAEQEQDAEGGGGGNRGAEEGEEDKEAASSPASEEGDDSSSSDVAV